MVTHTLTRPVFLSASEPSPEREPGYWINRKLLDVREAVRAFCAHVMLHYPIVFGGHPAITPLVWQIAERVAHEDAIEASRERREPRTPHIVMFQSRLFVDGADSESQVFMPILDNNGNQTPDEAKASRSMSLLRMRYEMLGGPNAEPIFPGLLRYRSELGQQRYSRLHTHEFTAAVFIGGMEGVEREFNIFRDFHPDTPVYPIASTGSASKMLLSRVKHHLSGNVARKLAEEPAYTLLIQVILPLTSNERESALATHWHLMPRDKPNDSKRHIDPEYIQTPPRIQL